MWKEESSLAAGGDVNQQPLCDQCADSSNNQTRDFLATTVGSVADSSNNQTRDSRAVLLQPLLVQSKDSKPDHSGNLTYSSLSSHHSHHQITEPTWMPIRKLMDKENVVKIHNGVLFRHKDGHL